MFQTIHYTTRIDRIKPLDKVEWKWSSKSTLVASIQIKSQKIKHPVKNLAFNKIQHARLNDAFKDYGHAIYGTPEA